MKNILLLSSVFYIACAFSQAPTIEWQVSLGGSSIDMPKSILQASDGSYIVVGDTRSIDGDVINNHGVYDCWIIKLNAAGTPLWKKTYGGSYEDVGMSVQQTGDSGYIVAGYCFSNDGDVTNNHGGADYWILKLDTSGAIKWQKTYGGSKIDIAESIEKTSDGGYIVTGWWESNDRDVSINYGGYDYWVLKLDNAGNIQWQQSFGGSGDDLANSVKQTADDGYIIAGWTESNDGYVFNNHGSGDYWLVKLDANGTFQWSKALGGSSLDQERSIYQTFDKGYIVTGNSGSNDGDVTNNHGSDDYWVAKLDSVGNIEWQKSLGGSNYDGAYSIQQTADLGYIVAGEAASNDGDVTNNHGSADYWLVKMDSAGLIQWQKTYGGSNGESATCLRETSDGGYILSGISRSNDGDVTNNHGDMDYWIVKLNSSSLPITLINFNATRSNNNALLTWQTASEINSSHFTLERSLDGIIFKPIATIKAAGNSNKITNYSFTDFDLKKLKALKIYYRLLQVDKDGLSKSSPVIVLPDMSAVFDVYVFPNPVSTELNVSIATSKRQPVQIVIADAAGKRFISDKRNVIAGSNNVFYNTSYWAKGIYFVRIFATDGMVKTIKLIKE